MTKNGKKIQEHLENTQLQRSVGCETSGHKYSKNGTISCIKCGQIKYH
jgi:hypothetical protein